MANRRIQPHESGTERLARLIFIATLAVVNQGVFASTFWELPAGAGIAQFWVHPSGQVAVLTNDTLYVDQAAFVNYGPGRPYEEIYAVALTGTKVIFSARVREDLVPNDCALGGDFGVFDSAIPKFCEPGTLTVGQTNTAPARTLVANQAGDYAMFATVLRRMYVVAPNQGYAPFPNAWGVPSWQNEQDFASWPPAPKQFQLLEDGALITRPRQCVRRYERETQGTRNGLELTSESCFDGISLTGLNQVGFNPDTGATVVCGATSSNSLPHLFVVSAGGSVEQGPEVNSCPSPSNNMPLNETNVIAYRDQIPSDFRFGIFLSTDPDRVRVARGHLLNGLVIDRIDDFSLTNDNTIIALAVLRDELTGNTVSGVLYADGDTDFPPNPNDPPEDELVWTNTAGGSFGTSSNWDAGEVPSGDQVAVFDSSEGYAVQFDDAARQTLSVKIEAGDVDFATGSLSLLQDSGAFPGVVVATGARLDVESGHALNNIYATVGSVPAGNAGPGVLGVSGDSVLATQARLVVGDAGKGQLSITDGGSVISGSSHIGNAAGGQGVVILEGEGGQPVEPSGWDTGSLSVGRYGLGELRVLDGGAVTSSDVYLGYLGGSRGEALVEGGTWLTDTLVVGFGGEGELTVDFAGKVEASDDISINGLVQVVRGLPEPSAPDGALPSTLKSSTLLTVGDLKDGHLVIADGASVEAEDVRVGYQVGADGIVNVAGTLNGLRPSTLLANSMTIGDGGSGELTIADDGSVISDSGAIGTTIGGIGVVFVETGGSWTLLGDLTVGLASGGADPSVCEGDETSLGIGSLIVADNPLADSVTGGTLTVSGPLSTLAGSASVDFDAVVNHCATVSPGSSPGTLTINGDLQLVGGVLEVELFGLADGEYDVLKVTGNADLSGGIIKLIFDGFLPQQGDQVEFLQATGALSMSPNMRFEYAGAIPGFDFSIDDDGNGNLVFTANNNALADELFSDSFEQ